MKDKVKELKAEAQKLLKRIEELEKLDGTWDYTRQMGAVKRQSLEVNRAGVALRKGNV